MVIRTRADDLRDELFPNYCMGVHGILISNDTVRLVLNELDMKLHCSTVKDHFYFTSTTCVKSVQNEDNIISCSACNQQFTYLQMKCIGAVPMRVDGVNCEKTKNTFL